MNVRYPEERRQEILELARESGRVSVAELSRRFAVSEMTIRSDLQALAGRNLLVRTHGGALAVERAAPELSFELRRQRRPAEKARIGAAAAALVEDGEAIFLDTSSTALAVARRLTERTALTVLTNGLAVIQELLRAPGVTVVVPGGTLRRESLSLVGADGLAMLDRYNIRRGFFGAHGLTLAEGLTDVSLAEAEFKRELAARCGEVVAVLDSSKLGQVGAASFAAATDLDTLITDAQAPAEQLDALRDAGITILTV